VNAADAARQTRQAWLQAVTQIALGPSTRRIHLARLGTGWAFFANGAAIGSWVPHIPDAKHVLGLTDSLLGVTLLSMGAGSLAGLPLSGVLTARFGSRRTTIAALFAVLLATPLPILAPACRCSRSRLCCSEWQTARSTWR
jgi:MFS family permease